MTPPGIFLLSLTGMVLLRVLAPGPELVGGPWNVLGVVLAGAGVALHGAATVRLRRADTTVAALGRPRKLVVDGVYGRTRNPMYLAGIVILLGVGVFLGSAAPFLGVPLFAWAVLAGYIAREERMLKERFGFEYLQYRSRVRRWI